MNEQEKKCYEAAELMMGNWAGPGYVALSGVLIALSAGEHPGSHAPVEQRVQHLKRWIGLLRMFASVCEVIAQHYEVVVLPEQEALL